METCTMNIVAHSQLSYLFRFLPSYSPRINEIDRREMMAAAEKVAQQVSIVF